MAANDAVANLLLRIRSEQGEAERGLKRLVAQLKEFAGEDAEAEARVETRRARASLREISRDLAQFSRETATAGADLDTREARIHLNALEERLNALDRSKVSATADVNIARALAKIAVLRRAMSAEAFRQGGPDINLVARETGNLAIQAGRVAASMKELSDGPGLFERMARAIRSARVNIGPFTVNVGVLGRLWLFMIPKIASVAAGLTAIASSAGAAVLALGALAVAAVSAMGPLLALTAGAAIRFASASEGVDEYRSAMEKVRGALRAQADAERNVQDAQENAARSQRELTRARREAAQQIRADQAAALQRVSDAEYNLAQAQQAEIQAQEQLTAARQQAIRTLFDLRSAAESAANSEEQARINLIRARRTLQEAEASGVRGLDLRQARLDVEVAEDALASAREQSKRAVEDLNEAERRGIDGSEAVVAAQRAAADASRASAVANRELAEAITNLRQQQARTIGTEDGVRSARQALAQANEQVADAERELARRTREVERAQKDAAKAARDAAPLMAGAGLALRRALRQIRRDLEAGFGLGIDRIWQAIADSLTETIGPMIRRSRELIGSLGTAIADSIRAVTEELSRMEGAGFFEEMIRAGVDLVPLLTRSFIALARIWGNIARASMPFLIEGMRSLAEFLEGIADRTSNISRLRDQIGVLVEHLKSWIRLGGAVLNAVFQLARAASGPGKQVVDWLTEAINAWAEWASTAEGQNTLKGFFQDMMPLFKGLIDLVLEFIELLINISRILGPALAALNRLMTTTLDLFNDMLGVVADLPGEVRLLIGAFILWRGPVAVVRFLIRTLIRLGTVLRAGALLGAVTGFGATLGGLAGGVRGLIGRLGGLSAALRLLPLGAAAAAVVEWGDDVGRVFADVLGYGDDYIRQQDQIADAQGRLADKLFEINQILRELPRRFGIQSDEQLFEVFSQRQIERMKNILARGGSLAGREWIRNAVRAMRERKPEIFQETKGVVDGVADQVASGSKKLFNGGRGLMQAVIDGIRSVADAAGNVMKKTIRGLRNLLPGSEPKDKSSPLTNLDQAGRAIIENLSRGMMQAANRMPNQAAAAVAGRVTRTPVAKPAVSGNVINHNNYDLRAFGVQGGGYPDADVYIGAVSRNLRKRGLSLS